MDIHSDGSAAPVTLEIDPDPPAALLLTYLCGYTAQCRARGCRTVATIILRKMDTQGRFLRQIELCEAHAEVVVVRECARGLAVEDRR